MKDNKGGLGIMAFLAGVGAGWLAKRYLDTKPSLPGQKLLAGNSLWNKIPADVRETLDDVSADAQKLVREAEERLRPLAETVQDRWEDIDTEKYNALVQEMFQDFKDEQRLPTRKLNALRRFFLEDYRTLRGKRMSEPEAM